MPVTQHPSALPHLGKQAVGFTDRGRTMSGSHSDGHVRAGSPCAAVTGCMLQSFNVTGVRGAFTS